MARRYKRVYPRLRGGSGLVMALTLTLAGLSPPTRGIRLRPHTTESRAKSIPAYAGDPPSPSGCRSQGWVYPRLRGGSLNTLTDEQLLEGLSPPTRGIPVGGGGESGAGGSIPAYAGDPSRNRARLPAYQVYPRLRGGSWNTIRATLSYLGLSPPTRGIHKAALLYARCQRSIPAYAGDPPSR